MYRDDGDQHTEVWEVPHAPMVTDPRHGEGGHKGVCVYPTLKVHPTGADNPRKDGPVDTGEGDR